MPAAERPVSQSSSTSHLAARTRAGLKGEHTLHDAEPAQRRIRSQADTIARRLGCGTVDQNLIAGPAEIVAARAGVIDPLSLTVIEETIRQVGERDHRRDDGGEQQERAEACHRRATTAYRDHFCEADAE